jgi:hypothetical protein
MTKGNGLGVAGDAAPTTTTNAAVATQDSLQLQSISNSQYHPAAPSTLSGSPIHAAARGIVSSGAAHLSSPSQLQHEIVAAGYKHLMSRKSSRASNSNSLWLEQDLISARASTSESHSASASGNWSSSSMSSLFFNKTAGGPMMMNTFEIVGNYFYASPEMAAGVCVFNQSVDWWAVGVLLFHMLSGTTPFEGLTKAATLDNIEHKRIDWDPLPPVSPGCEDFLKRILQHSFETRLGSKSGDEVIEHGFFTNVDFQTLYDGYGPIYPRPPHADESSADYYCFSLLTEEESLDVPQFSPDARRISGSDKTDSPGAAQRNSGAKDTEDPAIALQRRGTEDEIFQDFDYHPF